MALIYPQSVYRHTPVQMRNFDTGRVTSFRKAQDLAVYLGVDIERVIERARRGPGWLMDNRHQFRVDEGDAPWPSHPESRFILVKDTLTGKETRHLSQVEVGNLVGVGNGAIHDRIKERKHGLILSRYLVKAENDPRSWKEVEEKPEKDREKREKIVIDLNDESHGEYRYLEEFPGIRIYRKGWIVRESDGKLLGYKDGGGYYHTAVPNSSGVRVTVGNHRLVAMAYHGIPDNHQDLHVNHIDFDTSNNEAKNLEWTTPYENSKHSGYLNREGGIRFKPIQVRNFDTKEVKTYHTMLECAIAEGVGKDGIQERANRGDTILHGNRQQYRLLSEEPWCETPDMGSIKLLEIFTGEEFTFQTAEELCKAYKVSAAAVSVTLSKNKGYPLNSKYLLKYESDHTPWPDIRDPYKFVAGNTAFRPVVAFNPSTNDRKIFMSAAICAREMGLATNTLGMRLKSGKPEKVYADGYKYDYYGPGM